MAKSPAERRCAAELLAWVAATVIILEARGSSWVVRLRRLKRPLPTSSLPPRLLMKTVMGSRLQEVSSRIWGRRRSTSASFICPSTQTHRFGFGVKSASNGTLAPELATHIVGAGTRSQALLNAGALDRAAQQHFTQFFIGRINVASVNVEPQRASHGNP